MNNKCIDYVEGPCEQQLIAAVKEAPERLIPMLSIQVGTFHPVLRKAENHFSSTSSEFGG